MMCAVIRAAVGVFVSAAMLAAFAPPHAAFDGIWNSATATPR